MPRLSGTWKDTAQSYALHSPRHVADPRHGKLGHEPAPGDYAFQSPPYPYAKPRGREDFGTQEVPDIRGLEIDRTPDTHEIERWGMDYTTVDEIDHPGAPDADILAFTHRAHTLDQGASRKHNYSEKTLQFYDEEYRFFRVPGLGAEAGDPIPPEAGGGQRGLNGLTTNNPPLESYLGFGFWPGHTEQAVVNRKFQARVIQRNDERAQTLNLPFFEQNSPAPKPGNPSTSPFSGLQRMVSAVAKIPLVRKTPPNPGDILAERVREDDDSPTVEAAFYG